MTQKIVRSRTMKGTLTEDDKGNIRITLKTMIPRDRCPKCNNGITVRKDGSYWCSGALFAGLIQKSK